jgi:glycosyltransferase involved in cell wall biosynthesis
MAVEAMSALLDADWKIDLIMNNLNERFDVAVKAIRSDKLNVHKIGVSYDTVSSFFPSMFKSRIKKISAILDEANSPSILLLQSRIESCRPGYVAARRRKMKVISYVPFAHSSAFISGKKIAGALRDLTNRAYYKKMDGFITCYRGGKKDIEGWAPNAKVFVVDNFVKGASAASLPSKRSGAPRFGVIGRIDFSQKCQDFLVNNFETIFSKVGDASLVIAGDGRDSVQLAQYVRASPFKSRIELIPWLTDPSSFYDSLDCLLIPSRYEGMPLVLLEAAKRKIAVAASAVDGMKDFLPEKYLFQFGIAEAASIAIGNAFRDRDSYWTGNHSVLCTMGADNFRSNFVSALDSLV